MNCNITYQKYMPWHFRLMHFFFIMPCLRAVFSHSEKERVRLCTQKTSEYINLCCMYEAVLGRMQACLKKMGNLHVLLLYLVIHL